ncbi:hypothetical protein B0H13DRAFT_1961418, partial [Mycena leptocephala]
IHIHLLRRIPDYPPPPHPSKSSASAVRTYIHSSPSHPLLRSRPIHRSTSATATISVMHGALPLEMCARQRIWDKAVRRVQNLAAGRVPVHAREVAPRLRADNVHEAGPRPTRAHDVLSCLESYTKLQRVARCRAVQRIRPFSIYFSLVRWPWQSASPSAYALPDVHCRIPIPGEEELTGGGMTLAVLVCVATDFAAGDARAFWQLWGAHLTRLCARDMAMRVLFPWEYTNGAARCMLYARH